jgi:dTMP kinase
LKFNALSEAFVVNASRAQLLSDVIEPAIAAGRFVLCDRFADATLAYQGYGRGVDLTSLRSLVGIATAGRVPDRTLLVDVPVGVSRERVRSRAVALGEPIDRLEREDAAFHERVRDGYLELARGCERFVTLDGTQPAAEVLEHAIEAIEAIRP